MATDSDSPGGIAVSQENLEQFFGSMSRMFAEKMDDFKRELAQEQEHANERLAKWIRLEKPATFRKKGFEKQFQFNEEVKAKVVDAAEAISKTPAAVSKAKTLLEEGEKLLVDRQKLLRIADRSENGWATVEEYMEDELADNSDDEKRIQKAEMRAGRKLKAAAAAKRKKAVSRPASGMYGRSRPPQAAWGRGSSIPAWRLPAGQTVPPFSQPSWYKPAGRSIGPCWHRGKEGHFRNKCPLLTMGKP